MLRWLGKSPLKIAASSSWWPGTVCLLAEQCSTEDWGKGQNLALRKWINLRYSLLGMKCGLAASATGVDSGPPAWQACSPANELLYELRQGPCAGLPICKMCAVCMKNLDIVERKVSERGRNALLNIMHLFIKQLLRGVALKENISK